MENNNFFNRAFGKDRDPQTHARAMLLIYGIIIAILVVYVRLRPHPPVEDNPENNKSGVLERRTPSTTPTPTQTPSATSDPTNPTPTPTPSTKPKKENDVNYAYSYTISYDGVTEVYLGKKIDYKEKFSYIKNGKTLEYAIMDDEYLIKSDNDIYKITDKLNNYFRYCKVEKILKILENRLEQTTKTYTVTNKELADVFDEKVTEPDLENTIEIIVSNNELKGINIDLSNYRSEVTSLTIKMDFADIGKVEDFEIKMN